MKNKKIWYWIGGIVIAILLYRWWKNKNTVKVPLSSGLSAGAGASASAGTGGGASAGDVTIAGRRAIGTFAPKKDIISEYYNSGGFCYQGTTDPSGDYNTTIVGLANQGPCANLSTS